MCEEPDTPCERAALLTKLLVTRGSLSTKEVMLHGGYSTRKGAVRMMERISRVVEIYYERGRWWWMLPY